MQKSTVNMTVAKFVDDLNAGRIDFEYPIQRNGGQWNDEKASLLMHSFMDSYPVPPVYSLLNEIMVMNDEEGEEEPVSVFSILDGKQRLTRIRDFVTNQLQIHAETPPVTVLRDGKKVSIPIAGEYFDTIDDEVRKMFLNAELSMVQINSATEEEIENVFFRLNNGEALTKTQQGKSIMGSEWAKRLTDVAKHPAMTINAQFTPLQKKKADDEMTVVQTMMIMDSIENNTELKSISSNHAFEYIGKFKAESDRLVPMFNKVVEGLDYIHEAFEQNAEKFLLKKVHMTASILTALHAKEKGIAPIRFRDWTSSFELSYRAKKNTKYIPTLYSKYSKQGTVLGAKALGRVSEMIKHFDTYIGQSKEDEELGGVVDQIKMDLTGEGATPATTEITDTPATTETTTQEEKVDDKKLTKKEKAELARAEKAKAKEEAERKAKEEAEKNELKSDDEVEVSLDGIIG